MIQIWGELIKLGIDIEPIKERFLDDEELYFSCYKMFMNDNGFEKLKTALLAKDYKESFDIAHNLKGVSANLGLILLYDKICVLVESLRSEQHEGLDKMYEEILKEKTVFSAFLD